jgi:hypothetical protein
MKSLIDLAAALRAHANGVYPLEAAAELLISHRTWLRRADFCDRFIHHGISITDGLTKMVEIDWPAAITALDYGDLAASSSEQQILRLAASIADGLPKEPRPGSDRRVLSWRAWAEAGWPGRPVAGAGADERAPACRGRAVV